MELCGVGKCCQICMWLMTKINRTMAEMICTTVCNKNINGRDDPRSSNFKITPKIA